MTKKERWLVWVGYIRHETEEGYDVDYYGRFCPTKTNVIGILRSLIDNTAPYKMIVIDTEKKQIEIEEKTTQTLLTDLGMEAH